MNSCYPCQHRFKPYLSGDMRPVGAGITYFRGRGRKSALGDPRKTLEKLREAMGDPELGFHDLRRSFAVQCGRLDVSHSKIKRMMNHAEGGDVTMGYLVSTDPERLRTAMQSVSDEMDKLESKGTRE